MSEPMLPSTTTPAFTRLPAELLDLLLDKLVEEYYYGEIDTATLRSLRLACRQYAQHPRIMHSLFARIRLLASPEHVERAHATDFSFAKQYATGVVVKPTKYSWTMRKAMYEEIVLITPLQHFVDEERKKIWERREAGEDVSGVVRLEKAWGVEMGIKELVHEYTRGEMPFSDEDIERGFERYMQHARRTRDAFEAKDIQRAWTRVLEQLPGVHTFKIGMWKYDQGRLQPWEAGNCEIHAHGHFGRKEHDKAVCRRLQEPVGEALFSAAIASLAAARSKLTSLTIKSIADDQFAWADNGALDTLDLSRLKTLSFQPVGAEYHDQDSAAVPIIRYSLAVTALLDKCSTTLETLDVCSSISSSPMSWPPDSSSLPVLPALSSFRTCCSLRLSAMASFVTNSPSLRHIQLECCGGGDGAWRELWDAIRNHPNRMELEFEQLPCIDWTELSVFHNTGEASQYDFCDDPYDNIGYSLDNYLSGRVHWNRSLRSWFDNDDESSEEEQSDEEEDDEEESDEQSDEEDDTDVNDRADDMCEGNGDEQLH